MSETSSRSAEARRVANELLDMLESSPKDIDSALLKAMRLARLMRDADAQTWLAMEVRGYPDGLVFSTLGNCQKYAEASGRISAADGKYYLASLPQLGANLDSEQALMSAIKPVAPPGNVKDFVEKNATEALMKTQMTLQSNQKQRFATAKHLFSSIKSGIHSYTTDMYIALELGDAAQGIFEAARTDIDNFVRLHCPQAAEKLVAISERISEATSESQSAALTSCRRLLMTVADSLFPPREESWTDKTGKPRKVGVEQYKNRLLAFMSDRSKSGSDAAIIESELELIAAKLDAVYEKTCKGVHVDVSASEARLAVISTYILLGEIARFSDVPAKQEMSVVSS